MQRTRGVSSGPRETGGSEQSHSGGKASNIRLRKCGAQFQAIAPGAVGKISGGRLAAGGGRSPRRGFPGGRARPSPPAPPHAPAARGGSRCQNPGEKAAAGRAGHRRPGPHDPAELPECSFQATGQENGPVPPSQRASPPPLPTAPRGECLLPATTEP